jgi:hypothetical protein
VGRAAAPSTGFSGAATPKPEEHVTQLLDLYRRCCTVFCAVEYFQQQKTIDRGVRRALDRLGQVLAPVNAEVAAQKVARKLDAPSKLFDELRDVLRLDRGKSPDGSPDSISPDEQAEFLQKMEQGFKDFSKSLRDRQAERGITKEEKKMLDVVVKHLDRHGHYLWGHVVQMPERAGGGIRIVPRTNNILEGFFHQMKHGERRRSGRKVLTQDFEGMPAAAALVYNLTRPDYVKLVCGSLDQLPALFSALDVARRERELATPKGTPAKASIPEVATAGLPLADRRLVRKDSIRDRIRDAANHRKSSLAFQQPAIHKEAVKAGDSPSVSQQGRFEVYVPYRKGRGTQRSIGNPDGL